MGDWDSLVEKFSKKHQTRRANKYGAVKVKDSKGSFDSQGERGMHAILELMERKGMVSNIRHHPPSVQLTKNVKWRIDWIVFDEKRKKDIYVEFKGLDGERFKILMQLWPEFGPGLLQIWRRQGDRFYMAKEVEGAK